MISLGFKNRAYKFSEKKADKVGYLSGWIGAWNLFIYLPSGSVHVSCVYHRRNKMEAGTVSGHDIREIQGTHLHKCLETLTDATYYNLSSRMYLGLQDNKYRHYTNTSSQVQNELRNLPLNQCSVCPGLGRGRTAFCRPVRSFSEVAR